LVGDFFVEALPSKKQFVKIIWKALFGLNIALPFQTTTTMPLVSIITPNYNSAAFLPETIASVLSQHLTDWEWIICDDCSTDQSMAILQTCQDPRLKIIQSPKNRGAGVCRNLALKEASGRYITFLDSDDVWLPNFLSDSLAYMTAQNAELVYSNYARCNENLEPILKDFVADTKVTFGNLLKTCRLSLLSSIYDSQRVGKVYFAEGSKREDHVMWLNLLKKIPQGVALPKCMAKYRMRQGSISRQKKNIIKDQYLVYREHMNFGLMKSLYYTFQWAFNGFVKYNKVLQKL
jgi:teichuronic acid biosynthesis glycosyltransferase TuaG